MSIRVTTRSAVAVGEDANSGSNLNFLRMRVFEYSTKALGNQVIAQILESSNTQKNLVYSVLIRKQ